MYDAIVVGARCSGSATAMLLARKGYRVLLADQAGFPSDTVSCHYIHQPGVAMLRAWGLLEKVAATGCPPIERQIFDAGPFALSGAPPAAGGVTAGYAPRRTVLDKILVDAAVEAGAELRERFAVKDIISDGDSVVGIKGRSEGGSTVSEPGRMVIGADGVFSVIARLTGAPAYNGAPAASCAYYSYWSGVAVDCSELYPRPGRMLVAVPTNDRLTMMIAYWPQGEFAQVRSGIEGYFMEVVEQIPRLAERVHAGRREEKFRGSGHLEGYFRRPYGPGWALVGDAGYHKNPITAAGMTDAFRDAQLLSDAIDESFSGRAPMGRALAAYEKKRNEAVMPLYQLTCELAKLEPPSGDMQQLLAAMRGNEAQVGRFIGTIAGTVPIPEFFSPENVRHIVASAGR